MSDSESQPIQAPPRTKEAVQNFIATFATTAEELEALRPSETRQIVIVLYDGLFPLDMIGPQAVFSGLMNTQLHLLAKTAEPIKAGAVTIVPTGTFADCPDKLSILLLPGGTSGTLAAMQDPELIDFVRTAATRADYVTSVCTGSLILGAAGLLQGKRATTHWAGMNALTSFGATPVKERFVEDGHTITAAGVSAGIDFALYLAAKIAGEKYARSLQLDIEYNPAPPFQSGSPDTAPADVAQTLHTMYAPLMDAMAQVKEKEKEKEALRLE